MKKICIITTIIAIIITSYHLTNTMFTRAPRITQQLPRSQRMRQQMQRRFIQTQGQRISKQKEITPELASIPLKTEKIQTSLPSTGLWSYWTALKNKIFTPSLTSVAIKEPIIPVVATITPKQPLIEQISPQKLISWINALKTLPETKNLLQKLTNTSLDNVKINVHIPNDQWTHLIEKTRLAVEYIQNHCFSQAHSNVTWDVLPKEIEIIMQEELNNNQIFNKSISVHYRDTIDIDPFGHDTISVTGPTITYSTDMTSGKEIITGYEPATITIHKQNISKLTKNQFKAKLQHVITHLKQSHNEQITLLQESIGPEKFEQYAHPYKQALEREADFLEAIKDPSIAKIVQQAFLEEALNFALNEIKENRKKHGLDNKETNLMICTPPGNGPHILESIASFEDLENYLNNEKEKIIKKLASVAGYLLESKIEEFKNTTKQDIESINTICYKRPLKGIIRDKNLSPFIIQEAERLLKKIGINPLSVNILSTTQLDHQSLHENLKLIAEETQFLIHPDYVINLQKVTKDSNGASNPRIIGNKFAGNAIKYTPAFLIFDQNVLSKTSHQEQIFIIAHEIGHLLLNHQTMLDNLKLLYTHNQQPIRLDLQQQSAKHDLINDFKRLCEIEADITYAKHNPKIAKIMYTSYINKIGANKPYILSAKEQNPFSSYYEHPSYFNRYYWIKKIIELHQKENEKKVKIQPLFTPEKE